VLQWLAHASHLNAAHARATWRAEITAEAFGSGRFTETSPSLRFPGCFDPRRRPDRARLERQALAPASSVFVADPPGDDRHFL
jgi:hypothetical protein